MTVERPRAARWLAALPRLVTAPLLGVLAVSAALAGLGALLWSIPLTREQVLGHTHTHIPWWVLALLVAGCELVVLHIQVRREAHAISLSELAVVLGLFFASPVGFVAGRLAGALAVFVAYRRQSAEKVLFNSALNVAESTLALLVFHAIHGPDDGPRISPRDWLSALGATVAAGVLAALAVTAVIALVDRELRARDLLVEPARGAASATAVTCFALVAAHALADDPWASIPLVISVALLVLGWRAYSGLSERHQDLGRLIDFSKVVSSSTPETDDILTRVLQHAREVLRGEHACVVLVPSEPGQPSLFADTGPDGVLRRRQLTDEEAEDPLLSRVIGGGAPLLVPRGTREPAMRAFLARTGYRDAVLAPLAGDPAIAGTIVVGDRMGEVRTFDDDDVELLSTVANHTGMALRNGRLVVRLQHDALHDMLTGLPNRTMLNRTLAETCSDVRTGALPGATVMVMDLVGFKQVNDTLGHHVGDALLTQVGDRMAAVVGRAGLLARLGGDEFSVVLPGVHLPDAAMEYARALQASLVEPITLEGVGVEVGVSIGVALAPAHGTDGRTLLKRADAAMYEAKGSGEGPQLFESGLEATDTPERLALVAELRAGIQNGELEIHLQPQARLREPAGEVAGAEALVRWRHPRHGLLFPDEFIPLAERTGLIRPLTIAVLEQAAAAARTLRDQGRAITVAVNLSARSTISDEMAETVEELLERHGLAAEALTLEITESSVIRDPVRTAEVLDRLHALGVRLSIDDFGTGYSSLSYLRQLPVQEVKVDKSFVQRMLQENEDATIVRSIVDLGANLGLEVVAEGVEDELTWNELAEMGCDLVQGYYLAAPMPAADFPGWLDEYAARKVPMQRTGV